MGNRKVAAFVFVSLDGFFEGPNHELDWFNSNPEFEKFAADQLDEFSTLLFGSRTFDLMQSYWPTDLGKSSPEIARRMNSMPKVVFSSTHRSTNWHNARIVSTDAAAEIHTLKSQAPGDLLILGSNDLIVRLIEENLLDELRVLLCPVAIGRGHSLFTGLKHKFTPRLASTRQFRSGNILLTYRSAIDL
jgi:dihydrofolate reductase